MHEAEFTPCYWLDIHETLQWFVRKGLEAKAGIEARGNHEPRINPAPATGAEWRGQRYLFNVIGEALTRAKARIDGQGCSVDLMEDEGELCARTAAVIAGRRRPLLRPGQAAFRVPP